MKLIVLALLLSMSGGLTAQTTIPRLRIHEFEGDTTGDVFGHSVSGAGDVNNDGYDDVIVGAHSDDNFGNLSGSARVHSGYDGAILYTFYGNSTADIFGWSVGGAGDVNDDGFDDLIVGAPATDTNGNDSGSARIISGSNGAVLFTLNGEGAGDQFGFSVSGAGDINNDGFDDVVIGAQSARLIGVYDGSAYVYSGFDGTLIHVFRGPPHSSKLGWSVSGAGDVNGDGYPDVIAGAFLHETANGVQSGSAHVYSGLDGSTLFSFSGDAPYDQFGYSVSGAGDVNSDGFADVIVGAWKDDNNGIQSGSAIVFSGIDGSRLYMLDGEVTGDHFGITVSDAGDVNFDGYADVVIGAMFNDANGLDSGSARVVSGFDGSTIETFRGDNPGDHFGNSVSSAGDSNNDGYDEIIVGAWRSDPNGFDSGTAHVLTLVPRAVFRYYPVLGGDSLALSWSPDGLIANSKSGTIDCIGATPGGLGIIGLSFNPVDVTIFGIPLLIANDPINLIDSGGFGFDASGQISIGNVTRQAPALAGTYVYLQLFQSSPIPMASNGLGILLVQ